MHLSEKSHRGTLLFVLFAFSLVCVFVHNESRGGSRREDRRQLIFYPSPACLSQGKLCHKLSACQRWVLLFQSTGQLTFLLSLLHLLHNTSREKKLKREEDAPCSLYSFALSSFSVFVPCQLFLFIPFSLYPPEARIHNEKKWPLFILSYMLSA